MAAHQRWTLLSVWIVLITTSLQAHMEHKTGLREDKAHLAKALLKNYTEVATTYLRPMTGPNGSDVIFVKWVPLSIINFKSDEQSINLRAFLSLAWEDPLLTWDPAEHSGVDWLVLPSSEIWRPNVVLNESVEFEFSSVYYESESVLAFPNGCVFWESPVITSTFCKFGVEAFPFDSQRCALTFFSTEYGQVHFNPLSVDYNRKGAEFSKLFTDNGVWDIGDQPFQSCRCSRHSGLSGGTVFGVRYTIQLQRRSVWFHLFTLFLPCVLLSILSVFVFCLPVESGEKISFTITILLSLFVYQTVVAAEGPDTGSPIFAYYIVLTIIEGMLGIVGTIHVISFHFNTSTIIKFDDWLMKSVRRYTVRLSGSSPGEENELRPPEEQNGGNSDEQANPPQVTVSDYSEGPARRVGGHFRRRNRASEEERAQMKRKGRIIELERGLAFIFIVLKVALLLVFVFIELGHVIGGNASLDEDCGDCVMYEAAHESRSACLNTLSDYYS